MAYPSSYVCVFIYLFIGMHYTEYGYNNVVKIINLTTLKNFKQYIQWGSLSYYMECIFFEPTEPKSFSRYCLYILLKQCIVNVWNIFY